jgi:hypothetical protein
LLVLSLACGLTGCSAETKTAGDGHEHADGHDHEHADGHDQAHDAVKDAAGAAKDMAGDVKDAVKEAVAKAQTLCPVSRPSTSARYKSSSPP